MFVAVLLAFLRLLLLLLALFQFLYLFSLSLTVVSASSVCTLISNSLIYFHFIWILLFLSFLFISHFIISTWKFQLNFRNVWFNWLFQNVILVKFTNYAWKSRSICLYGFRSLSLSLLISSWLKWCAHAFANFVYVSREKLCHFSNCNDNNFHQKLAYANKSNICKFLGCCSLSLSISALVGNKRQYNCYLWVCPRCLITCLARLVGFDELLSNGNQC